MPPRKRNIPEIFSESYSILELWQWVWAVLRITPLTCPWNRKPHSSTRIASRYTGTRRKRGGTCINYSRTLSAALITSLEKTESGSVRDEKAAAGERKKERKKSFESCKSVQKERGARKRECRDKRRLENPAMAMARGNPAATGIPSYRTRSALPRLFA